VFPGYQERGGLQKRARDLMLALAETHDVFVLAWRPRVRPSVARDGKITIISLPRLISPGEGGSGLASFLDAAGIMVTGVVAAVLLRKRWKSAYAEGLSPAGVTAALAGKVLRRRVVLNTWLPGKCGNVARLMASPTSSWQRRILRRCTVLYGTLEVGRELKAAGFEERTMRQLDWGVDLDYYAPPSTAAREDVRRRLGFADEVVCLYSGRFDLAQKRLDLLLRAWGEAEVDNATLVLVGEGKDSATVRAMCAEVEPRPRVEGWVADVRPFLAAADLFLLPTNAESGAASVREGMAMRLPGLVSAIPSYLEMAPEGVELVENEVSAWVAALQRRCTTTRDRLAADGGRARSWVLQRAHERDAFERVRSLLG
jgi:glycosyltransferase involved in cell wall biosynthesis